MILAFIIISHVAMATFRISQCHDGAKILIGYE